MPATSRCAVARPASDCMGSGWVGVGSGCVCIGLLPCRGAASRDADCTDPWIAHTIPSACLSGNVSSIHRQRCARSTAYARRWGGNDRQETRTETVVAGEVRLYSVRTKLAPPHARLVWLADPGRLRMRPQRRDGQRVVDKRKGRSVGSYPRNPTGCWGALYCCTLSCWEEPSEGAVPPWAAVPPESS